MQMCLCACLFVLVLAVVVVVALVCVLVWILVGARHSGPGVCKATYSRFNVIWASTSAARNANIFQPSQCAKNSLQAKKQKQQAFEAKTNWDREELSGVEFSSLRYCSAGGQSGRPG